MKFYKIQGNKKGLLKLIISSALIVLFVNSIIFIFNFRNSNSNLELVRSPLLPAPYIIGTVWLFLILCMSYSQWILIKKNSYKNNLFLIPILFIICILYPFYTQKFNNESISLVANLVVISYSSFISGKIYQISKTSSFLIFLTAVWVTFATYATNIKF
ncbi:TspO/MBR family protein [Silvanigrella sp.]|jgi:tryptophan-rich sensory protein|uniref:TspO/MBR family protein n=1 Tax=Silvanigrella sp. TaxID=2024976 RepID=UPI0037CC705F|nr:tryptophan-rich sensory protein [Silvanigrellaceae bacterium]